MAGTLSAGERVQAALTGGAVDRPPISIWHHFPERDQRAEDLAEATHRFWASYEFDFIKFMPPGDYPTIDWGARSAYTGSRAGTRETVEFPVAGPRDWTRLQAVDASAGMHAEMNRALGVLQRQLRGRVPVLQTIFSPLTIAQKLSNGLAVRHAETDPAALKGALAAIAETTGAMTWSALAGGADGIFFATQCATREVMDEAGYAEFGTPFDLAVLEGARGSSFTLLHLHGNDPYLSLTPRYPVHAVNWHDRRAGPPLPDVQRATGRCVVGGLNEQGVLTTGAPDEVRREARGAVAATGGHMMMVAPGCVVPIDTPAANIAAAVAAVRAWGVERGA